MSKYSLNDFFKSENINDTANCIRRMAVGLSICEYAEIELQDKTKQDLKQRCNAALAANRRFQDWFIHHPDASKSDQDIFKGEFLSGKLVLMGRLIEIAWKLEESGIEELISELEKHMGIETA